MGLFDAFIRGTEFFSGSTEFKVKVTSDGEMATTATERERNVMLKLARSAVSSTVYVALIDLSDTTNFPHDSTGRIDVSWIRGVIDKSTASRGTVSVGVITRIDGTDADISYLTSFPFENNGETKIIIEFNVSPSQIKFGTSSGNLHQSITDDVETSVVAVNTGLTLDSVRGAGTVTPAVGDIILKAAHTAGGAYNATVELLYHSESTAT